ISGDAYTSVELVKLKKDLGPYMAVINVALPQLQTLIPGLGQGYNYPYAAADLHVMSSSCWYAIDEMKSLSEAQRVAMGFPPNIFLWLVSYQETYNDVRSRTKQKPLLQPGMCPFQIRLQEYKADLAKKE